MSFGDTNKIHIGQMAFTMSINDVFLITAIISILALPCLALPCLALPCLALPLALFIGKVKKSGLTKV
ncbi:hypothetical protein P5G65_11990 [Paenibacillus chondroitinus]|uniref:Uncharacterized protein n=1 Tax=Paenibacillus chondroitinus TaxID=59842 RepID=A0ABU6DA88_9BACL|nr:MULTISPECIES: hypothetical protein [Paenibacillus]MCY9662337.1 hypothetical protein [Paenibacillus anseongense]MEB4794623.1 hypothetical protein [Paenibacillus chondroitinus]